MNIFPSDAEIIANNAAYARRWNVAAKNVSPHLAFTKDWFHRHQRGLLWLANSWVTRDWFRQTLKIANDVPEGQSINYIGPNRVTYGAKYLADRRIEVTTDFRTHHKFAKSIYLEFESVWWMLHQWDAVFADRMLPELSFGFDTLTAYPDPDPETTTVDGRVAHGENVEFPGLRNSDGNQSDATGADSYIRIYTGTTTTLWTEISRYYLLFDTSSLPDTTNISDVTLSIYGRTASIAEFDRSTNITSGAPASNTALVDSDYALNKFGSTDFATEIGISAWSTSSYNDFVFNPTGIAGVSVTSVSKFAWRHTNDIDNTEESWESAKQDLVRLETADAAGTSTDPKLVVIHGGLPYQPWYLRAPILSQ